MNPDEYEKQLFEAEKQQIIEKKKILKNTYNVKKDLLSHKLQLNKEKEKLKKKYLKK